MLSPVLEFYLVSTFTSVAMPAWEKSVPAWEKSVHGTLLQVRLFLLHSNDSNGMIAVYI